MNRNILFVIIVVFCCIGCTSQSAEAFPGVKQIFDVPYMDDNIYDHQLDLYLPETGKDFPMMIFVHGGGWRSGDRKTDHDVFGNIGRSWCRNKIGIAVISYRLRPEFTVNDEISDVAAAIAWVYNNAEKYNADPEKIIVAGQSAGAHLISVVTFNQEWLNAEGLEPEIIKGLILWSGIYSIRDSVDQASEIIRNRLWYPVFGKDPDYWDAVSPAAYISEKDTYFPDILILYAERDFKNNKKESIAFADLLNLYCPVELGEIQGEGHFSEVVNASRPGNPAYKKIISFVESVEY